MKLYKQLIVFGLGLTLLYSKDQLNANHYGIAPITQDQSEKIENKIPKVTNVTPNNLARARAKNKTISSTKPITSDSFQLIQSSTENALNNLQTSGTLPSSVDNTLLPSFPPIGDQGSLGSCVAFGSTYYHATHELGLLNGINNKTGSAKILSPKWTYNLLNDGSDRGLIPSDAYQLLNCNGAVSLLQFPYDTNYTAWELDSQDWVSALYNRLAPAVLIPGLGGSSAQNLTAIKQALANGHILTFATYIDSWVYTKIKQGPNYVDNSHVGEWAAVYMNGRQGGHFLTIVGYDDNLWIDVNNNGQVDSGEMGAFLIANSWGTNWGNHGLIWISYDAFLSRSAVAGGPSSNRVAAGEYLNSNVISVVPIAENYSPSLVAQFTLSDALRNQINVQVGVSNTSTTTPSSTSPVVALATQGGNFNFAGKSGNAQVTFAADLSDLLKANNENDDLRYYLLVNDTTSGNPTTLSSFSIVDLPHSRTISSSETPKTYDRSGGSLSLDYNFVSGVPSAPTVSMTAPSNGATVNGTITIAANASGVNSIARVLFAVDGQTVTTITSPPYQTTVDTTRLSNGSHQMSATAFDSQGKSSGANVNVNVQNTSQTAFLYVNAGGPSLSAQGTSWNTDESYVSGSTTTSNNSAYSFSNPVYQSARYGNMTYSFSVPNGNYLITLKFAEIAEAAKKSRIFNVSVNGKKSISKLDIAQKVGLRKAYDVTIPVAVSNGNISIQFTSMKGSPQINGIQIVPNAGKTHVKHVKNKKGK